jgi:hypothetical protein
LGFFFYQFEVLIRAALVRVYSFTFQVSLEQIHGFKFFLFCEYCGCGVIDIGIVVVMGYGV